MKRTLLMLQAMAAGLLAGCAGPGAPPPGAAVPAAANGPAMSQFTSTPVADCRSASNTARPRPSAANRSRLPERPAGSRTEAGISPSSRPAAPFCIKRFTGHLLATLLMMRASMAPMSRVLMLHHVSTISPLVSRLAFRSSSTFTTVSTGLCTLGNSAVSARTAISEPWIVLRMPEIFAMAFMMVSTGASVAALAAVSVADERRQARRLLQ
jgi:hypothetical protein